MSKSRLGAPAGAPPVRVVFTATTPGTAGSEQLYDQHRAAINHFHIGARQAVDISGQEGFAVHQDLPGVGRLRYVRNNGQETIHVQLASTAPTPTEETEETAEPVKPGERPDYVLIDFEWTVHHPVPDTFCPPGELSARCIHPKKFEPAPTSEMPYPSSPYMSGSSRYAPGRPLNEQEVLTAADLTYWTSPLGADPASDSAISSVLIKLKKLKYGSPAIVVDIWGVAPSWQYENDDLPLNFASVVGCSYATPGGTSIPGPTHYVPDLIAYGRDPYVVNSSIVDTPDGPQFIWLDDDGVTHRSAATPTTDTVTYDDTPYTMTARGALFRGGPPAAMSKRDIGLQSTGAPSGTCYQLQFASKYPVRPPLPLVAQGIPLQTAGPDQTGDAGNGQPDEYFQLPICRLKINMDSLKIEVNQLTWPEAADSFVPYVYVPGT